MPRFESSVAEADECSSGLFSCFSLYCQVVLLVISDFASDWFQFVPFVRSSTWMFSPLYRSKLDRWPKIQNVTCVTFLIGSTLWPKTWVVTVSHSLLGQLYGPNRDQKLFQNSNTVKKLLKNSKNRVCDSVTFLIGSTCWPKKKFENGVTALKMAFFWVSVTWQGHRSNLLR